MQKVLQNIIYLSCQKLDSEVYSLRHIINQIDCNIWFPIWNPFNRANIFRLNFTIINHLNQPKKFCIVMGNKRENNHIEYKQSYADRIMRNIEWLISTSYYNVVVWLSLFISWKIFLHSLTLRALEKIDQWKILS